jgi:molybdopterin-guanine dinucleotide biosynthesis protein B
LWREGSAIVAVASDESLPALAIPFLDLNDTEAIADFVLAEAELTSRFRDEVFREGRS